MNDEERTELNLLALKLVKLYKNQPEKIVSGLFQLAGSYQGTEDEKGELLLTIGCCFLDISEYRLAIDVFRFAEKYFSRSGKGSGITSCYINIGVAFHNLGDFKCAIENQEKALEIAKKNGDRAGEAKAYMNLAIEYHRGPAELRKAIDYNNEALDIALDIKDKEIEMQCYSGLGNIYIDLADYEKAIEYLENGLEIAESLADRMSLSNFYGNLGNAYFCTENYRKAIEYQEKALGISVEIGDRSGEARSYGDLGNVYADLREHEKAIEYYNKALRIAKDIGDIAVQMKCLSQIGTTKGDKGEFKETIKNNDKALKIAQKIGDRRAEAACCENIGVANGYLGNYKKALEFHEKALSISRNIEDKFGEATCIGNLGDVYFKSGDIHKAISCYEQSLKYAQDIGDRNLESKVCLELYKVCLGFDINLAYTYCKRSIELTETIYGKLLEEEHKIGFLEQTSRAYEYIVPLCLMLNMPQESFDYVERSKSRAFIEMLSFTELRPNVELTSKLKNLLNEEENCLVKLREIQTSHVNREKVPVEPDEVDRILERLSIIYEKIEKYDPEYTFIRRGKPLSMTEIQNVLASQQKEVVLVEYFITDNEAYIFIISSKDDELSGEIVPLSKEKLQRYFDNFEREVIRYSSGSSPRQTWLELSKYLIEPVSDHLTEDCIVYFVPYGLLHKIPLHALELNGEPLIAKHAVAYLPSASVLKFCQKKGTGNLQNCACFGGGTSIIDTLRNAFEGAGENIIENEAEEIARIFNTTSYIGLGKEEVIKSCIDKDIIHFSCHGYFDEYDPLSSGVLLSEHMDFGLDQRNGWPSGLRLQEENLTAREIYKMRMNAELVTLSACETGLSERNPGDELIGLTRAFLYAGSSSVIASLWSVDAKSTKELMLEFYSLLKDGNDKATALQIAQKSIMSKEEYSHPYYWAPFVLVGDWQ